LKVYIDTLCFSKDGRERCKYGMSVYDSMGKNVFNACPVKDPVSADCKFGNLLSALYWGIVRLNRKFQNKKLQAENETLIYIPSKTVVSWFERETSPMKYIDIFSDVVMELNFFHTDVELCHSELKKVKFVDDDTEVSSLASDVLFDRLSSENLEGTIEVSE
jgi:hypothetical protein